MESDGAVAAIDCGTNSTRLLVTDAAGRPLERLMRITRLGAGVDASGRLAPDAIDRSVAVLAEYRQVMDRLGVDRGRLVATSAARDAANGAAFLDAAGEATGLTAELLTGPEEGRLSMAGAVADLDPGGAPFLVVDIGGGSTELIAGSGPDDPELAVVSLQLGCVRVSERFFGSDPPSASELADADAEIAAQVDRAFGEHPGFGAARTLVGLAGTVTTLASLELGLAEYDRDRIHHSVLTADAVHGWHRRLSTEPAVDRLARPGMVPGRQDVIVGGAMILDAVVGRLGADACLVSESDILDGLVAAQIERV